MDFYRFLLIDLYIFRIECICRILSSLRLRLACSRVLKKMSRYREYSRVRVSRVGFTVSRGPPSCHDFTLDHDRSAMTGSVNRYEIDSTSCY